MKKQMLRSLAIFSVIVIFGCASTGRQFDATYVNNIQNSVTDKTQIQQWFGQPFQTTPLTGHPQNCTERWTYVYAHAVGFGKVTESHSLVVDFDSNGKVCDKAYSRLQ